MIDDRIVLPLWKARVAVVAYCDARCDSSRTVYGDWTVIHDEHCLVPDIEARDALIGEQADYSDKVSPDCQVGGAKCQACTGCIHECHRPRGGASA